MRLAEILCAALIPFLAASGDKIPYGSLFTGVLGIAIAVSTAASSLFKFHENWIEYRTTAEQLKHEKFLYLTSIKPYDDSEKFSVLVQRVEGLISKENSSWAQLVKSQKAATPKT